MPEPEKENIRQISLLAGAFEDHHVRNFGESHLTPDSFRPVLEKTVSDNRGLLRTGEEGRSFEGRPLASVTTGGGPVRVLLWSQMHGDESTATKVLADLLRFVVGAPEDPSVLSILSGLTLTIVPMLNPDGAARCTRRTALGIDMNRDALALRTPEARFLNRLADEFKPGFAFNLHDQELSTVGTTGEISALSLLAPAADPGRSETPGRTAAKKIASFSASSANSLAPGRIARYDDGFEPRAFGDSFQAKGVSTILVESGHMKGDPLKREVRKLTFCVITGALLAIASGKAEAGKTEFYDLLPFNGKRAYDVIVRNVNVGPVGGGYKTDLGISRQVDTHTEGPPRLVDAGDLSIFSGLEEYDAGGAVIEPGDLRFDRPFDYGKLIGR